MSKFIKKQQYNSIDENIYDAISSTCNKLFIFSNTFIIGGIL